jgi:hypothetical protein
MQTHSIGQHDSRKHLAVVGQVNARHFIRSRVSPDMTRRAEVVRPAVNATADTEARRVFDRVRRGSLRDAPNGSRYRVLDASLQRRGNGETTILARVPEQIDPSDADAPFRQRPGLVEQPRIDLADSLDDACRSAEQADTRQAAKGHGKRRRRGE